MNFKPCDGLICKPGCSCGRDGQSERFIATYDSTPTMIPKTFGTRVEVLKPWNEDSIAYAVDRINDDGEGDDPDLLFCNDEVLRAQGVHLPPQMKGCIAVTGGFGWSRYMLANDEKDWI